MDRVADVDAMDLGGPDPGSFLADGRFQLVAPLGRGAMGIVYRVFDTANQCEVALKTFAVADGEQLYRLKQEFRVLSDITHANLVELYELVSGDDGSFFTMEYVDGVDFVTAMRAQHAGGDAPAFRVAAAADQLAEGVLALHASGRLHRDIKPSNVLVTRDGRVVILDFGLATALDADTLRHYGATVTGTFAYMAPELQFGSGPSAEADWYSVGALLFEALTGELVVRSLARGIDPFRDGPGASLPTPWKEILSQLLDRDPAKRRQGVEQLGRLSSTAERRFDAGAGTRVFVGRDSELAQLQGAYGSCASGAAAVVHVVGPSGIGKSELVRRFLASIDASGAAGGLEPVVALTGRCHPNESVPYKAFDSAIDRLSRVLVGTPALAAECLPEDSEALRRIFPVLERVPAFAAAPASEDGNDPLETRRRAFAALRSLFARLAVCRRVICWIDDFQWSDADSVQLLRELLRPPSPALLVLLSWRSEDAPTSELIRQLSELETDAETVRIDLGPLSDHDGAALLQGLGAPKQDLDERMSRAISEADGNPFLLSQLVRSVQEGGALQRMSDVVGSRVADLPEAARQLLETVSVAGGAVSRGVALEAAGLDERGRLVASNLEKRFLIRRASLGDGFGIEIYHDRIREAVLEMLPMDTRRLRHGTLADVMEKQPDPDPDSLYRHNLGAGRTASAGRWAESAGDRAAATLAFQRAAELFGEAIRLCDGDRASYPLIAKRSDALANGGRALEAAQGYEEAARLVPRDGGGSERQVLSLRQRAANHFLQTGHLDEGMGVMREVLRDVGMSYPRTQAGALLSSLRHRWRLTRRGHAYTIRDQPLDEARQLRLDACWSAGITLDTIDPLGSDSISVQHAIDALDSGDFVHTARALGGEAARTSQLGGAFMRRRAARLAAQMEELVQIRHVPVLAAQHHSVRGMIAFQAADWRRSYEEFSRASVILRRDCFGVTWEMATIETFGLSALAHMGELGKLAQLLPVSIGNASDRGDLYASLLFCTGVLNLTWLARDEGEEALSVAEDVMARWPASERFQVQHYVHLIATVNADLYRGDPWSAFARIEKAWPKLKAALFLYLESARVELRNMRARAALAAASAAVIAPRAKAPDPKWSRDALLDLAASEARVLAGIDSVASARPFAALIEAGGLAARGREEDAVRRYRDAEEGLRTVEMGIYAAAAGDRAATLAGGDARRESAEKTSAWAAAEGVRNPARMFAAMAPGGS